MEWKKMRKQKAQKAQEVTGEGFAEAADCRHASGNGLVARLELIQQLSVALLGCGREQFVAPQLVVLLLSVLLQRVKLLSLSRREDLKLSLF